jgi:hypothetical protein
LGKEKEEQKREGKDEHEGVEEQEGRRSKGVHGELSP